MKMSETETRNRDRKIRKVKVKGRGGDRTIERLRQTQVGRD